MNNSILKYDPQSDLPIPLIEISTNDYCVEIETVSLSGNVRKSSFTLQVRDGKIVAKTWENFRYNTEGLIYLSQEENETNLCYEKDIVYSSLWRYETVKRLQEFEQWKQSLSNQTNVIKVTIDGEVIHENNLIKLKSLHTKSKFYDRYDFIDLQDLQQWIESNQTEKRFLVKKIENVLKK